LVTDDGSVYCAGFGTHGQQGDGTTSSKPFFQKIAFPAGAGNVRYLACSHTPGGPGDAEAIYALMDNGDVYAWGYNGYGQLGLGDLNNRTFPTKIAMFNRYHGKIRRIAVAGYHQGNDSEQQCMALAMAGTVFAWGPSNTFSLGFPENQSANAPMRVRF
jgi:alpha-tubulin suppressor-like RCC1 family protein